MKIYFRAQNGGDPAQKKKNPALVQDGVVDSLSLFAYFSSSRATTYVAEVQ